MSTGARQEILRSVAERYRLAGAAAKRRLLDEFAALTGYHRKHAIRVLNAPPRAPRAVGPPRSRLYDEAVRQTLVVLWEASDRVCGKRLKALIPVLLPALERHGHLQLDAAVRERLLRVSAATMDRLLSAVRHGSGRRRRSKSVPRVRRSIAVRTFADWHDPEPGFVEIDLVAHCGESLTGSFVYTLALTDVASGWTECLPLLVREATLVVHALDRVRAGLPFTLRGIDTDNGSEFINEVLAAYCQQHGITFTRSRPYRKNDQAWIEQKNGAVVRRLVGYGRLEGIAAAEALTRLYTASRLFVNCFQPSFKLAAKSRDGARVRKRYHAPETPCARLLASPGIPDRTKDQLRAIAATLDPLRLLDEIRTVQHHLAGLAAGERVHVLPHRDADLDHFLRSLATAWRVGEVRPTHRAGAKPPRHWRTRKDPFEAVWPRVVVWLEAEPDRTAKELFARLRRDQPTQFSAGQLRTLQRRVKDWRSLAATRLLLTPPAESMAPAVPRGDDAVKGELAALGASGAP